MTSAANGEARVEEALEARSKLRGGMLTANVDKLRYANRYNYDKKARKNCLASFVRGCRTWIRRDSGSIRRGCGTDCMNRSVHCRRR